jgi:hypothetical protein
MKRCEFPAVAAMCLSEAASTQNANLPIKVAVLRVSVLADVRESQAFRDGLGETGLRKGRDIVLEIRSAEVCWKNALHGCSGF